jgi:hypothetical protein
MNCSELYNSMNFSELQYKIQWMLVYLVYNHDHNLICSISIILKRNLIPFTVIPHYHP